MIESDRFYKEGVIFVLTLETRKDKQNVGVLAKKIFNHGGNIIDNKFIGKISHIQSLSGDIEISLKL